MHGKENIFEKIETVNEERYDCIECTIFNPFCASLSISPVVRQKGESQKKCSKTKHAKFSKKNEHFLPPRYADAY